MKIKGEILEVDFEDNTVLIKSDSPITIKKEEVVIISVDEYIDLVDRAILR